MKKHTWKLKDSLDNVLEMTLSSYSAQMEIKIYIRDQGWFSLSIEDLFLMRKWLGEAIREMRCKYKSFHQRWSREKNDAADDYVLTRGDSFNAILKFDDLVHWNNLFHFNLREIIFMRREMSNMLTNILLSKKFSEKTACDAP